MNKKKISRKIPTVKIFNCKVGLAISGGVDSMVMLDIFRNIKDKNNLELYVLHYNHKWRNKSYMDADLVKSYCQKNNIKFLYKETKDKLVKNETKAREERYLFFRECSKKYGFKFLCTAHHKDDQIETVLFRLARGTGPKGLMPIKEFTDLTPETKLFRPLLSLSKEEIYNYASQNKISYIEDITNKDTKFKRNLVRLKIIPLLKKINTEAVKNILSYCELVYSQNYILDKHFSGLLKKISIKKPFEWNKIKFESLDEYTQKSFIYWFLSTYGIKGNLNKITRILTAVQNRKKIDLNKEYFLCFTDSGIIFEFKGKNKTVKNYSEKKIKLNSRDQNINLSDNQLFILKPFLGKKNDA